MSDPEFSRPVRIDTIGSARRDMQVEAERAEREALASRFDIAAIDSLTADLTISRNGEDVHARGRLRAHVTQSCVVTDAPVVAEVDEPFDILFRPPPTVSGGDEEIELMEIDMDVIFYDGGAVDIGEAVAETLSLSLDPYPRAPGAEAALKAAGVKSEEEAGKFGALAALRDKLGSNDS